jgi:tetratricopeptide (TPR) repeat protein
MPEAKKPAKKSSAKKKKAPADARVQLEEAMRQAFAIFAGEDMTKEDLDALTTSLTGPSAHEGMSDAEADAKDQAQQIAFDAMDAPSAAQARKLAKRALKLDPDCVDALLVITDLDAHTARERIEGLQRAVAAGERSLGEKFVRENKGHFWRLIETRPWMRALEQLATDLVAAGMRADAIRVYEKMLELNPNDNQGARDPLLGLYLAVGDLAGAGKLLQSYDEDGSANFAWGRVLGRFLAGDRTGADQALIDALAANRFVALYMTERLPLPKGLPEMYEMGSAEEAVLCVVNLRAAWDAHRDAVFWLYDRCAEIGMGPVPKKSSLKKMPTAGRRIQ